MLSKKIVQHINQLQQKKVRNEDREFLIEGVKGVSEALNSTLEVILLVIEGNRRDEPEFLNLIKKAEKNGVLVEFCGRGDIKDIKTTDTFPGVLAIVNQPDFTIQDLTDDKIICLDGIKDPGNLGTIIRTADWFGIKNILLSEDCVDVYNPKVVRSTMGSIFRMKIMESNNLVSDLIYLKKNNQYKIFSLTMNGKNINTIKFNNKSIFVIGSESHGVRSEVEKISDAQYTISGKGEVESLNAAIAAGILMSKIS